MAYPLIGTLMPSSSRFLKNSAFCKQANNEAFNQHPSWTSVMIKQQCCQTCCGVFEIQVLEVSIFNIKMYFVSEIRVICVFYISFQILFVVLAVFSANHYLAKYNACFKILMHNEHWMKWCKSNHLKLLNWWKSTVKTNFNANSQCTVTIGSLHLTSVMSTS